ncbi:Alpha-taxilin [Nymphaea thermarum]|nr:Alpha-taxilin [Nymphaea thermarum]
MVTSDNLLNSSSDTIVSPTCYLGTLQSNPNPTLILGSLPELKKKILELQLAELKLQQQQERSSQEQAMMKVYTEQVSQLLETEKNLRMQLASDGEKFQQFQEALSKSNEVFETFKQEMEKMAKSVKELKKENTFLKSKCEKSDFTLIKLVDEDLLTL